MNPSREFLFLLALIAAVGSGMVAGLLFAFSNFVMRALAQQPPESGVRTMQSINALIQNPIFFILFLGTTLVCAYLAFTSAMHLSQRAVWMVLAGSLFYVLGVFGVTMVFNVPLNNRLAGLNASAIAAAQFWPDYVSQWLRWNHVRTIAAIAATALLVWGIGANTR